MAVKPSQSASRVLQIFDYVARLQPVTLTALARATGVNMSALQRDLATLSDAGWVQQLQSDGKSWELTHHVMTIARPPYSSRAIRGHLRPVMERLHALVDEAVYFTVPHDRGFVVIEAIERPDSLKVVPPVGVVVPKTGSATGKAYLAAMQPSCREAAFGEPVSVELDAQLSEVRMRGYAVNDGDVVPGTVTLAAAICDREFHPVGALVVTGPTERLVPDTWPLIGSQLRDAALAASQLLHEDIPADHGDGFAQLAGLAL